MKLGPEDAECSSCNATITGRPGFAPPRGAKSQNLHRTSRGAGADFRISPNPEGREGRWRVTLIDPHKPAFA